MAVEMDPAKIVTDEALRLSAGNANFGTTPLRHILNCAVLQVASGFATGHTVRCMMEDLGLTRLMRPRSRAASLTKKGQRYLWACYGKESF